VDIEFILWYTSLHPSEVAIFRQWVADRTYDRWQHLVNYPSLN